MNGKTKQIASVIIICLVIIVVFLAVSVLVRMTQSDRAKDYLIYRQGDTLYLDYKGQSTVLLEGLVDYELFSLDGDHQHLLVIHDERSDTVDEAGYKQAIKEGHRVGGILRFYELIASKGEIRLNQIYENDFTLVNPWCISAGHMEEDDNPEIFIGAYRATNYYKADRRPYLLEWRGDYLKRRWTGSYLNMKTFYEAGFEDMDGDGYDELYAIQSNEQEGLSKYYYRWGYFSFDMVGSGAIE